MKRLTWGAVAVALALTDPGATWAQAAKARGAAPVEIEEITVTAQKREENLQEIPISVTALSGAALEEKHVSSVTDLTESVPNLYVKTGSQGESHIDITMRGTANDDPSLGNNPTTGMYVDGFYIAKIIGANLDLDDLERVEVLRGPQGTLYGKNTLGGAVDLITRKPTDERSITLNTEVGNYSSFKGRVTVNVPLIGKNGLIQSDVLGTLSLRNTTVYRARDGYWPNQDAATHLPTSGPAALANINRIFNMAALRWQPRSDIIVDYSYQYLRSRQAPWAIIPTYVAPGSAVDGGFFDMHPYVRRNRPDSVGNNNLFVSDLTTRPLMDTGNQRMHILTAQWDLGQVGPLGNVTLKSISGYRGVTADTFTDQDGSPRHIGDTKSYYNIDTWSEELQWVGNAPRVKYVLGMYYYGEHTTEYDTSVFYNGSVNLAFRNFGTVTSFAPFGQFNWTPPILNDKLTITAGLRYTQEHVRQHKINQCITITAEVAPGTFMNVCNLGIPGLLDFSATVATTFSGADNITPLFDVSYQWTDNLMSYARVTRGYQSGLPNGRASDQRLYSMTSPEKLWSYEAGFKSQWFGNRLRLNADGFFSRYTDQILQVIRFSPLSGIYTELSNAGTSEIWGAEAELVAIPLRGLETTLNYGYIDPYFIEWQDQKVDARGQPVFDPVTGAPVLENVAKLRHFRNTPHNTVSGGITYTAPPTSAGVFSAHVDAYWQDDVQFALDKPFFGWSYITVNGRLQLADIPLAKGTLDVGVFARNLLDQKYRSYGYDLGALGWGVSLYGAPRTFGLSLGYHFSES